LPGAILTFEPLREVENPLEVRFTYA